ncbi:MAG: hypothetical protein BJ554DRAFT_4840, partial [Olpidium bornovanus]
RIYTDIVSSLGIPAQRGTHVRLYVNKEFFGLYFMIDGVDASWASEVVAGGGPPPTLLKMNAESRDRGADLAYRGDSSSNYLKRGYAVVHRGNNPRDDPMADCVAMIKQLNDFNPKTASKDQLDELQALIDFDLVYRHAALEDYDHSFGVYTQDVYGGINANYKEWIFPTDDSKARWSRPLFDKTLAHPELKAKFERILTEIVQRVFHRAALAPRLEALHDLLREDVAADRNPEIFSPPQQGSGKVDYKWSVEHFDVLYKSGAEGRKDLYRKSTDTEHGILSFTKKRADIVAAQLNFSYDDTYVAPEDPSTGDDDAAAAAAEKQAVLGKPDEAPAEAAGSGTAAPDPPGPLSSSIASGDAGPLSSITSGATGLICSGAVAGLLAAGTAIVIDH